MRTDEISESSINAEVASFLVENTDTAAALRCSPDLWPKVLELWSQGKVGVETMWADRYCPPGQWGIVDAATVPKAPNHD